MSGIHTTSGAYLAKNALHAAVTTALVADKKVDITFGLRDMVANQDWVSTLGGRADLDAKNIGPHRQLDETITLDIEFGAWSHKHGDAGERAAQNRAFGLYTTVAEHIRANDITLGGTVLWCVPGDLEWDGATAEEDAGWGRLCIIAATFICRHRIR